MALSDPQPSSGPRHGTHGRYQDGRRVPDFFVVGHAKTGTTALHEMLRLHPGVFLPDLKEPMFLASDMPLRHRVPVAGLPASIDAYLDLFQAATPSQMAGEISPLYLLSATAASNIASINPDARMVAIFREPAAFLRSFHLEAVQVGNEDQRNLRHALALEDRRRSGADIPRGCFRPGLLLYSDHVRYAAQLGRFRSCFPAEQILVLIYEDLLQDNPGTIRRILGFLGLDEQWSAPEVRANPTVAVRSRVLAGTTARLAGGNGPFWSGLKRGMKALLPATLRQHLLNDIAPKLAYSKPPPHDEELMAELRQRFRPEVEALSVMIGRDLAELWGYRPAGAAPPPPPAPSVARPAAGDPTTPA